MLFLLYYKTIIMRNLIKITFATLVLLFAISCDNDTCPQGSESILDAQGNVIDCVEIPRNNF